MQAAKVMEQKICFRQALAPWIVSLSASLFFLYEFIQGNMFASIADNIMADFSIQADKMTLLSSMYYFANVLFLFVAGFLLDKFSSKKIIIFFMGICVLSTFLLAKAEGFYFALICRFMIGIGSAFCFLGPVRIAAQWFPPQRMALITGMVVTIGMTGGLLAQYPLTKLVIVVGWRDAVWLVGCLGVVMLVFMAYAIKEKPMILHSEHAPKPSLTKIIKSTYFNPQTLAAALYTSLMNMGVAVFGAMMGSLYLVQRLGIDKESAALVNSMLFLGIIIGGPLIGSLSDRWGRRVLPMRWCALSAFILLMVILYAPVSMLQMAVLFFLLGLFTSGQVVSYALVAEKAPPYFIATAMSVISLLTQGGYIIYQMIFSALLMWRGPASIVNQVPVYQLVNYQDAAIILPIGVFIALLVGFVLTEKSSINGA